MISKLFLFKLYGFKEMQYIIYKIKGEIGFRFEGEFKNLMHKL